MSEVAQPQKSKVLEGAKGIVRGVGKYTGNAILTGFEQLISFTGTGFAGLALATAYLAGRLALDPVQTIPELVINGAAMTTHDLVLPTLAGAGVSGLAGGALLKGGHSIGRLAEVGDVERITYNLIKLLVPVAWIIGSVTGTAGLGLVASTASAISTFVRLRNRRDLAK